MTSNLTPSQIVALLTKLPSPPSMYNIPTGTVSLFTDASWSSTRTVLYLNDYLPSARHTIPSSQFDRTTWVLFNIPIGTVLTLQDNVQANSNLADLSGCGTCVDLVGTGSTEAVDLTKVGFNDKLSMFFYRPVNLSLGAIELFGDDNFTGRRTTIFLSEWETGKVHSLGNWYLNDATSSMRWKTCLDRQVATFYNNFDGSGDAFANIKGWGSSKEIASFRDVRMNDIISAFSWKATNPVKEIIAPFVVVANTGSDSLGLTSVTAGVNEGSLAQPVVVSLKDQKTQIISVGTTDTFVEGISSSLTQAAKIGAPGTVESTTSWSVSVSFSYTHTETRTMSETKLVELNIAQTVNAAPYTVYKATLLATIGNLPPTQYKTTAERWYTQPVTGGVMDPFNNGWYKRVEEVVIGIAGSLACQTQLSMTETKMAGH